VTFLEANLLLSALNRLAFTSYMLGDIAFEIGDVSLEVYQPWTG
jgi:hypothetical protein